MKKSDNKINNNNNQSPNTNPNHDLKNGISHESDSNLMTFDIIDQ